MSSWTCLVCGTHNDDILDKNIEMFSPKAIEMIDKEMDRRMEYENRGEIPPMYCSRCRAQRQ